jgi:ketosteroid isomerase-like protein
LKMSVRTTGQDRNEQLVRRLYHLAEATSKDTQQFVSLFADGGYFYDVAGGKKYYGSDIGLTVDVYAAAFPDMHRELDSFYFDDNVVIVELSLNGTHKGDLAMPAGTIPATGKEMHAPCCDVFHIENGKITDSNNRDVLERVFTRPRQGPLNGEIRGASLPRTCRPGAEGGLRRG